jgi:hypothetical protein
LQQGVGRGARRWRLQGLSGNRFSDAATTGHLQATTTLSVLTVASC